MTRKGHHLDKIDEPAPIRKATTTNPWASYARCDECGVDAGKACRDMDDCEALEVCDGRRLSIDDRVSRLEASRKEARSSTRRDAPPSPLSRYRERRGITSPRQLVACQHCGEKCRTWGHSVATGIAWCSKSECQRARRRETDARKRERKRANPERECATCGRVFRWRANHQRFCASRCRDAHRAPPPPSERPDAVPCVGCGVPCAPKAVRWRTCGRPSCRKERRRLADQERAGRVICDLQTVTVTVYAASQRHDLAAAE